MSIVLLFAGVGRGIPELAPRGWAAFWVPELVSINGPPGAFDRAGQRRTRVKEKPASGGSTPGGYLELMPPQRVLPASVSPVRVPSWSQILAVSYDIEREKMERFRKDHGQLWPTSFSGRMLWQDPVGRLYQAAAPGWTFLPGADGRLAGAFTDEQELADRLTDLMSQAPPAGR